MKKATLLSVAAALNIIAAGAACSSARGNEDAADGRSSGSGDTVTVAGCLSGQDGRFALTAAPDATASVASRAVVGDERETHSYVLVGGNNLQSMVGKRVEVTGTVSGRERELEHDAKQKSEATNATGGKETPTVKTTEEVEVEFRQLHVQQVREVAQTCTLTQ